MGDGGGLASAHSTASGPAGSRPCDLDVVGSFAHRVRSCITAIGAAADYMLEADLAPDKQREMLYIIDDEVATINDLLADLLVVASSTATPHAGPLACVDLSTIIRRAVHRLASSAQTTGAWLVSDAAEPCPPVLGDEHLLQQAILSALRSVVGLARAGDRVVASLRPLPAQAGRRPQVELTIGLDAGAPEEPEEVTTLPLEELPLVAVRLIADRHGGEISSLTDRVGLRIALPAAPATTRPETSALACQAGGGSVGLSVPPTLLRAEGPIADASA